MTDRSQDIKCPECGCEFDAAAVWINALWAVKAAVREACPACEGREPTKAECALCGWALAAIDVLAGPGKTCGGSGEIVNFINHGFETIRCPGCSDCTGEAGTKTIECNTCRICNASGRWCCDRCGAWLCASHSAMHSCTGHGFVPTDSAVRATQDGEPQPGCSGKAGHFGCKPGESLVNDSGWHEGNVGDCSICTGKDGD